MIERRNIKNGFRYEVRLRGPDAANDHARSGHGKLSVTSGNRGRRWIEEIGSTLAGR